MFVDDGKVAGHHGACTALDKVERLFLIWRVQVVKEDPSYATGLSSVADVEVPVTPGGTETLIIHIALKTKTKNK